MTDRVDTMSADWKDGYETGFAEASFPDASSNRVYTCPRCKEVIPSADWHDSILGGHTCDAIPNNATWECPRCHALNHVSERRCAGCRATPNRVQRDVILQAILDEFALWNTPPKATVKMPNRGDASELANAIVRALERAT